MKRLFPFPLISAALGTSWLALMGVAAPHLVLALVLACAIPRFAAPFLEALPRLGRPLRALRLLAVVFSDIVLANIAVAKLVLGPLARLRPDFVEVPLEPMHSHAVALLATIITMTPGTVSVSLSQDARVLLVHALDVEDPVRLVATIKARYERPLMEIFEW